MISKIFRSTLLVAAVILLCSLGLIMGVLYGYSNDIQVSQIKDELRLAAAGTEESGMAFLHRVESQRFRLTWVDADGKVLFDTHAEADRMENHGNREEIQEAIATGTGSASRKSDTLMERTIYEAMKLSDGTVLRIAVTQQTMMVLIVGMLHPVCVVAVIAIILSAVLAKRSSVKIMAPINRLDLEHPLENDTYEELAPVLGRIHQQHMQMEQQMKKLQRKTDEFEQIIQHMQEGLVLLDKNQTILSINPAAKILFNAGNDCIGCSFYTVDRQMDLANAVEAALRDGRHETKAIRKGREYQFLLNRIESGAKTIGLVILAVDITDVQNAERNRREFSANVSHELKTPLQSIMGSAELLESGLVKPEDQARFVGHIRKEASRLVLLIDDVIRISHLDEGVELPKEEVDILGIAEEVATSLQIVAAKRDITIHVSGDRCSFRGIRGLVGEIVQNLASNAVKYNVDGGRVDIFVKKTKNHVVLTVADTGIGIPPEHQSRVFERFYRVDKSHSKQSGGTGLGLSIVKHAVQCHNARLNLQSTPGGGTTITVTF